MAKLTGVTLCGFGLNWKYPEVEREFSNEEIAIIVHLAESVNATLAVLSTSEGYHVKMNGISLGPEKYIPAYKCLQELGVLWPRSDVMFELSGEGFRLAKQFQEQIGEDLPEL